MSVSVTKPLALVSVATTDTTVINGGALDGGGNRYGIGAFSLNNTSAAARTVSIFESPNLTSASGVLIDRVTIPVDVSIDSNALIGQGFEGTNIIAVADDLGVNIKASGNIFTGE